MILDESKYNEKLNTIIDSGVYKPLQNDPTVRVDENCKKFLSKHKTALLVVLQRKLSPYYSRSPQQ
jgi:hypothetical protein